MRRVAAVALACLAVCFFSCLAVEKKRPEYHKKFFEPSEDVVTPHIPWATPYAQGKVRALFITHRNAMREVIEIAQRLSMAYKVFAMESPNKFGETGLGVDASWKLIQGNSAEELADRLRGDLKSTYDVIVLAGIQWDILPLDCQYEILKKAKAGTGLAGYVPGGTAPYLERLLAKEDFAWRFSVWSGKANNLPDFFGIGEFEESLDSQEKHIGEISAAILGKKVVKGSKESPRAAYYCPAATDLVEGAEYRLSVWYKTKGLDASGARVGVLPHGSWALPPSDAWKEHAVTFKVKKGGKGSIYLWNYGVGQVWFDDVSLVRLGDEKQELAPNGGFERGGGEAEREAILGGAPFAALPAFASVADPGEMFRKHVRYARFGKGRVALFKGISVPNLQGMTPGPTADVFDVKSLDYDYYLSLAIKTILWAAQKEAPVHVSTPSSLLTVDRASEMDRRVTFRLRSNQPIASAKLRFVLRDGDGAIHVSQESRAKIAGTESVQMFSFPPAPAGRYFADLWVVKDGTVAGWGSVGVVVTSPSRIVEITFAKESFKLAEAIAGAAALEGVGEGLALRAEQHDNFGRLLAAQEIPLKAGQAKAEFALNGLSPLSILQTISVKLMKGDEVVSAAKKFVPVSDFYPDREDVRFVMWQSLDAHSYLSRYIVREFYRNGIDTQYTGFTKWAFLENLWFLPYAIRFTDKKTDWYQEKRTRTKDDLVRDPCLTDPKYLETVKDTLTKAAQQAGNFSTDDFSLGDECLFVSGPFDICCSPTCNASFREWAKKEYGGDLAALNKEYGAAYKSWDAVMPGTLAEAEKTGNYAAWIDHRRHMESVWAGIYDYSRKIIKEIVPTARVGYEGSNTHIDSWSAGDYYKLMKAMDLDNIYFRPFIADMVRDFGGPGILFGGGWYGGYAGNRNEAHMRWIPWMTLFRGANSFWVWMGRGSAGSVMTFDLSLYPFFEANCAELREIKGGIGKLMGLARYENDGIAILYSPPSVHVNTITKDMPRINDAYASLCVLLEDLGLQYRVVAGEEVKKGILKEGGFRILFVPMAQAMCDGLAAEIRSFAEGGGAVIADVRPAVANEHGTPRPAGALDDLFGVKQDTKAAAFKISEVAIGQGEGIAFAGKLPEYSVDTSLKAADGKALGKAGETPTMIVKGKAVILNFSFAKYHDSHRSQDHSADYPGWTEGAPTRALMRDLLGRAGAKAPVIVEPQIPRCQIARFRQGDSELVGVLPGLPRNGMAYTLKEATIPPPRGARIRFPRKAHIYDVRAGKYLGYRDACDAKLQPGRAQLFALLPYKVKALELTGLETTRRGQSIPLRAVVRTDGKPDAHVLRLTFLNPKGEEVPHYAQNGKAINSQFVGVWTPALNDPTGVWRIQARDVISGQTAAIRVQVTEQ
ncbi:MAG: beta-galactosidase [Planctomycetota bacterium]